MISGSVSWIIPIYDFTQISGSLGVGPEAVDGTKKLLVFIYGITIILLGFSDPAFHL